MKALFAFVLLAAAAPAAAATDGRWNYDGKDWKAEDAPPAYGPVSDLVWSDGHGNEIGRLSWKDGICKFTGIADPAAERFFDILIKKYMQPYIDSDLKKKPTK